MTCFRVKLIVLLYAVVGGFVSLPAEAGDVTGQCQREISSFCDEVISGRGRITACLYAREGKLSADCRGEVERVVENTALSANSAGLQDSDKKSESVRLACAADIDRFCATVINGEGRTLACLYSRQNVVSSACSGAMDDLLSLLF